MQTSSERHNSQSAARSRIHTATNTIWCCLERGTDHSFSTRVSLNADVMTPCGSASYARFRRQIRHPVPRFWAFQGYPSGGSELSFAGNRSSQDLSSMVKTPAKQCQPRRPDVWNRIRAPTAGSTAAQKRVASQYNHQRIFEHVRIRRRQIRRWQR